MDGRQLFDVDPTEKDEFRVAAAGKARWDQSLQRWYMSDDDVSRSAGKALLAQWRPPHVHWPTDDADTNLTVYAVPHECLRCKLTSLAVVGFSVDKPEFDDDLVFDATGGPALKLVADALTQLEPRSIHRHTELAHLRRRFSRTVGEIYFANCCRTLDCEFLFGQHYLHQALVRADERGTLIEIARVAVPHSLFEEVTSDYEDD